jgi:tyrosyl-tRNA synthetase
MQPQDILMTKMVPGLDGRKMSTSWGNVINIIDAPDEQFGKAMSLHDDLVVEYAESVAELPAIRKDLKSLKGKDIKALKEQVAFEIVRKYHGEKAARAAQEHFEKTFSKREFPVDAPVLKLPRKCSVLDVAVASCALPSKSEARRLIEQGGFEYSGQIYKDPYAELKPKAGDTLRLGKKRFFRVKI